LAKHTKQLPVVVKSAGIGAGLSPGTNRIIVREDCPVTPHQIDLVQTSFAKIAPNAAVAADLFYARLFQIAPDFRRLFPGDLTEQKKKFVAMLDTAVGGLVHRDLLMLALQALGRRHAGYGVTAEQFAPVGTALLWTLQQVLGRDFTSEVKDAWAAVYDTLSLTMIDAMERLPKAA
jgi:hemoglobin-like flavoprotein